LNSYKPVHINKQVPGTIYTSGYPGLGQQMPSAFSPESSFSPFLPAATQTPSQSGSGLLSNINFKDIKAIIDRMGGIEGIISTVSKVQKVMQTLQQFGPMLKLLIPKLGTKKAIEPDDDLEDYPIRRRRRRPRNRHRYGSRRRHRYTHYSSRKPALQWHQKAVGKRRRRRN